LQLLVVLVCIKLEIVDKAEQSTAASGMQIVVAVLLNHCSWGLAELGSQAVERLLRIAHAPDLAGAVGARGARTELPLVNTKVGGNRPDQV